MLANGWGRIVNIASIAGKEGNPTSAHYSASKAGVIGLTKSLGKELATSGVLVNAIAPAVIRTEILTREGVDPAFLDITAGQDPDAADGRARRGRAPGRLPRQRAAQLLDRRHYDLSGGRATY